MGPSRGALQGSGIRCHPQPGLGEGGSACRTWCSCSVPGGGSCWREGWPGARSPVPPPPGARPAPSEAVGDSSAENCSWRMVGLVASAESAVLSWPWPCPRPSCPGDPVCCDSELGGSLGRSSFLSCRMPQLRPWRARAQASGQVWAEPSLPLCGWVPGARPARRHCVQSRFPGRETAPPEDSMLFAMEGPCPHFVDLDPALSLS